MDTSEKKEEEVTRIAVGPLPAPWRVAIVLLIAGIAIGGIIGYGSTAGQTSSLQAQITILQSDKAQLQSLVSSLEDDKAELQDQVSSLESDKAGLQAQIAQLQTSYNSLQAQYQQLQGKYQYSATIPYTLIWNGTVEWYFKDLKGNVLGWQMPIDTYRTYANTPKSTELVRLQFENGTTVSTLDIRPYIEPGFFINVVVDLTKGHTDKEFVVEVDNVKNQIIVYGSGLGDFYRWPAETMTECRGQCGDTTILMASMLIEGNNIGKYGMRVYVWYVDADHVAKMPTKIDHAIVEVEFKDGTTRFLETTTNYLYYYEEVCGWKFDVTNQGTGG